MRMNDVMIAIYGVCGMAAAFAPPEVINFKLSSMALILIYSTHMFWNRRRSMQHVPSAERN